MTGRASNNEQGTALQPSLLDLKRIVSLTDAAQALFNKLYDLERVTRRASKARLKGEMDKLDLLGLTVNRSDSQAQEYQPEDGGWCS